MTLADKVRVALAFGFPFGAISHVGWVIYHGDVFYHGPAPSWAVWFWYGLCVIDFVVFCVMLRTVRLGLALASVVMGVTMIVNWTQFPTFEYGFNFVLVGLTNFAVLVFLATPWLWRASSWRLPAAAS
ncbi:MAG: hypothetical protein AAGB25_06705 [Pseudomonadota bacterium]